MRRPPPTDEQVLEFESFFQVMLPQDYLILLRYSNGGHPELDSFQPKGASEQVLWGINRFYHLDNDLNNIEGLWRTTIEWRRVVAKRIVPVANDRGGNQIMLHYESVDPTVEICLHDEDFRLIHAADSFGEWIDMLCKNPDLI